MFLACWWACAGPPPAELLVEGGTIVTEVLPEGPATATALAVEGGRVVALDADALDRVGPDTERLDLGGAWVLPGFLDPHVHLLAGSFALDRLLLLGATSSEGMAQDAAAYAEAHPEEPWVIGYGWTEEAVDDPTGVPLSEALPDRPALLVASSGHAAIVNRAAMDLAGIDADTPDPPGGTIVRGEDGEPTGYLLENALSLVSGVALAAYDDATLAAGLAEDLAAFAASGVTGVGAIMAVPGIDLGRPWIYRELDDAGELPLRVSFFLPVSAPEDVARVAGEGPAWEGGRVHFGGGKLWVDGSMGTAEAWMLDPLETDPDDHGTAWFTAGEIADIVREAEAVGLPLKLHVNGDAAVRAALDAFATVAAERGGLDQPHALEHAVLVAPGDLDRILELGLAVSVQPAHWQAAALGDVADAWGEERFSRAYDHVGLLRAGVAVGFGTDWPVWPSPDPLVNAWNAVAVRDPEDAMTPAEALWAGTAGAAEVLAAPDQGRLRVGDLADFVVLDRDPFADPDALAGARVQEVRVGGQRVP